MTTLSIVLIIIFSLIGIFFIYSSKRLIKGIINYRKLGKEEFMRRLKEGAEGITPAQKTKAEINGNIIVLIGIIVGLIVTPIVRIENLWYWVEIILLGSLVITCVQLLGKWQLYKVQKQQDEIMKSLNSQDGSNNQLNQEAENECYNSNYKK